MRKSLMCLIPVVLTAAASFSFGQVWRPGSSDHCQILDSQTEPVYEIGVSYIFSAEVEENEETGVLEFDGNWNVAYFRDVACTDVDIALQFWSMVFMDSAGVGLPNQVALLALDAGGAWRWGDGMAFTARMAPGIYSDLEDLNGRAFSIPFSLAFIRSFNPQLSGILGSEIRSDFDRQIMPIVGAAWEINDSLRLEAGLPESRFFWFIHPEWIVHLGLDWRNISFATHEKSPYNADMTTVDDFRMYAGLTHRISDELQLKTEFGKVFNRSVEFEGDWGDSDVDIEDASFLRIALGGPF